jgi:hypothetical protein
VRGSENKDVGSGKRKLNIKDLNQKTFPVGRFFVEPFYFSSSFEIELKKSFSFNFLLDYFNLWKLREEVYKER